MTNILAGIRLSAFAKCKRFEILLKERGLTPDILYYEGERAMGMYDDHEKATRCSAQARDPEFNEKLENHGKKTGLFSTISGIEITPKNIPEGDIPMSLATCDRNPVGIRTHVNLQDLIGRCDITELHTHNGDTPSVHLHIECKDSSNQTLEAIAEVIKDANSLGRDFCHMGVAEKKTNGRLKPEDVMF